MIRTEETEDVVRFTPRDSHGWPSVAEVAIYPDRLEFQTAGVWKRFAFDDLVTRLPYPRWVWKLWKPFNNRRFRHRRCYPLVAYRDWCQVQGEKYYVFCTKPHLKVILPAEHDVPYEDSLFVRIRKVIEQQGGYSTGDLG